MIFSHHKMVFFLPVLILLSSNGFAQPPANREALFARAQGKMIYPLIKGGPMCGVLPVDNITNAPDADKEVKLIFDFTQATPADMQATHTNAGLEEVARVMNLHIAAGTKKEKLKTMIVFHSGSILSVMNDAYYREKYNGQNPNKDLLNQFIAAGTQLVICGQSLMLRDIAQGYLLPQMQVATSAKTTLTKYHSEGYFAFAIQSGN